MLLSVIAAMDRHGVIGTNGRLPWRLSADLRRFRTLTMGKPIVMGRRTHESIGRALPGRRNIVLSRTMNYHATGCDVVESLAAAFKLAGDVPEVVVIGGATVYGEAMRYAKRLYLTEVDAEVAGDVYFPTFDRTAWQVISDKLQRADEQNEFDHHFQVLVRIGEHPDE